MTDRAIESSEEVIALRALVGRQTARLASAIGRRAALASVVRRGLTAPSGVAICCCTRYAGAVVEPPCWYCELRAALVEPATEEG